MPSKFLLVGVTQRWEWLDGDGYEFALQTHALDCNVHWRVTIIILEVLNLMISELIRAPKDESSRYCQGRKEASRAGKSLAVINVVQIVLPTF